MTSTCTRKELASLLTLSERRITELTKSGVLPPPKGRGGYPIQDSVNSYVAFLRSQPKDLTEERARLTKFQADLAELAVQERNNQLVTIESVKADAWNTCRVIRDNFLALPDRLSGLLAAEGGQEECYQLLTKEILQMLEEFSNGKYSKGAIQEKKPRSGKRRTA